MASGTCIHLQSNSADASTHIARHTHARTCLHMCMHNVHCTYAHAHGAGTCAYMQGERGWGIEAYIAAADRGPAAPPMTDSANTDDRDVSQAFLCSCLCPGVHLVLSALTCARLWGYCQCMSPVCWQLVFVSCVGGHLMAH